MRTKSRYEIKLNEEQLAAVTAPVDKPVVVLAGPGSGKTAVIAARYSHLVDVVGIAPKNIIAVTFTSQMAGSLLERIKVSSLSSYASEGISTIHAFALRQLKALGIITNQQKAKDWTVRKEIDSFIALNGWDKSSGAIRWWLERSKIDGIQQDRDSLSTYYKMSLPGAILDAGLLAACATQVQNMLFDTRTWTFPDLVNNLWQATSVRKVHADLQSRIKYILVDEGQDTFELAVKLLRKICPDAFFIVGDQDQMLYRFTGASPETNLFKVAEDGALFKLTKNYRSVPAIVRSANNLISNNYNRDTERYMKKMTAVSADRLSVIKRYEFDGPAEEAKFVVETIRGYDPGTVFVGARTNAQLAYVETELASVGIPYTVLGTNGFFFLSHVKRVMNLLKKVEDPSYDSGENSQDESWQRSLSATPTKLLVLGREYGASPMTLVDKAVTAYLTYHRKKFGLVSADAGQDDNIVDDLRTLVDISSKFKSLHTFLEFVRKTERAEWMRDENGVVVLSTIHKLKGAERDIVFGIGWSEGLLPHSRAMSSQPDGDLPIHISGRVNDERCAAFVLVTRARKEVHISSIRSYRNVDLEPSRFVEELMA